MWVFSTFTLVPSRPRFSTLPTMPTARITRSTVISWLLPPASIVAVTLSLPFFSAFDRGAGQDLHALLLEGLLGEGRDLLVLDRQDAVEHLDHRHLGAHGAVEARELDADRAGADHQQRLRERPAAPSPPCRSRPACRRAPGPGSCARPRAGRQDDVLGGERRDCSCRSSPRRACAGRRRRRELRRAVEHRDLVLLHQAFDAVAELVRDLARALDDLLEIEGDVLDRRGRRRRRA